MNSMKGECSRLQTLIPEYLDGRLSIEERTEFENHLSKCPGCAAVRREYAASWEALELLGTGEPSATFTHGIFARKNTPWIVRFAVPAVAVAASILFAVLFWVVFSSSSVEDLTTEDQEVVEKMELLEDLELAEHLDLIEDDQIATVLGAILDLRRNEP